MHSSNAFPCHLLCTMIFDYLQIDKTNWYSGIATGGQGGAVAPPGSILALKKYAFSKVALNVKSFFWTEKFEFRNSCPPWNILPPPLENFLATPLVVLVHQNLCHGNHYQQYRWCCLLKKKIQNSIDTVANKNIRPPPKKNRSPWILL